ncbi:MAG: DUF4097 family beta strand repeat-containing protein [Anaerolineales bacterium]|jgi:hypothetical protein
MKSTLPSWASAPKPFKYPLTLSALLLLSACSLLYKEAGQTWSVRKSIEIEPKTKLILDLEHAELILLGGSNPLLTVQAESQHGTQADLSIERDDEVLYLAHRDNGRTAEKSLAMTLGVPDGARIDLRILTGSVSIRDFEGVLHVESRSATLHASNVAGELWVTTPRGAVSLENSSGEIHILGQAGPVSLSSLHGEIFVTTIMGDIQFEGQPVACDRLKFETDHASVLLQLFTDSDAQLDLNSSGGQILCSFPGLNTTGLNCSTTIGAGAAQISIRTVSGPIRIENWPWVP